MKKKFITLLVVVILLAVLLVVFFCLKDSNEKKEKDAQEIKTEAVSQTEVKDIEGIIYASESTSYEAVSLVREKDIWYYEEDKEFPLDQNYVTNNMVLTAAEASANKTLDNPTEDLTQYGFDNPRTEITLRKINGDTVHMVIGDYNESVEGYYLKVDGDDKIYLVDGQMVFAFDMSVYEIADKEDYPLVEESSFVHIKAQKGEKTLELAGEVEENAKEQIVNSSYMEKMKTWKISKNGGTYQKGNQEAIQELIANLSAMDYSGMMDYKPDKKALERYGLGEDAMTLTVDYQVLDEMTARQVEIEDGITEIVCDTIDKQYVLKIGNPVPEDGYSEPEYYVAMEGSVAVYSVTAETLRNLVEFNEEAYKAQ